MKPALARIVLLGLLVAQVVVGASRATTTSPLAERLGFKATDKILIINVDDVGNSHAANAAVIDAMENGLATSSTIIVPGPWFPEIAAYARAHPKSDFGVHLCHTSEWKTLKWGPVASKSEVPGLVDPQGYLWPDIMNVYKNSTPEQAYIEARAQIKKALDAGIDVTHIDSHMGTLQYNEAYFQVYRRLAKEFDLPLRMGSQELLAAQGGGHQRGQLDSDGTVYPDYLIHGDRKPGESVRDYWKRELNSLKPGVTELYIHASVPGDEIKNITNSWEDRATEYEMFTRDPEVRHILESQSVKRIGYRALRDLQRKSKTQQSPARSASLFTQTKEPDSVQGEANAYIRWYGAFKAGDKTRARSLADQYVILYPRGRYADFLIMWLKTSDQFPSKNEISAKAGLTALFEATDGSTLVLTDLAEAMIESGSNVNTRLKDGKTALMLEAANGRAEQVKTLIDKGAEVDAKEETHGWTALMYAIWKGDNDTIQLLLDHGADPRLKDKDYRTAIEHAHLSGDSDITELLQKSLAKH